MKILVLSDSHGHTGNLTEIFNMHKNADLIVFLGDGVRDAIYCLDDAKQKLILSGNCDGLMYFNDGYIHNSTLDLDGTKIFCTHGHLFGVKYGLMNLQYKAEEVGAKLALYGHTHTPLETQCENVTLFNPGSVKEGSFGLVYLEKGKIVCSHGQLI